MRIFVHKMLKKTEILHNAGYCAVVSPDVFYWAEPLKKFPAVGDLDSRT